MFPPCSLKIGSSTLHRKRNLTWFCVAYRSQEWLLGWNKCALSFSSFCRSKWSSKVNCVDFFENGDGNQSSFDEMKGFIRSLWLFSQLEPWRVNLKTNVVAWRNIILHEFALSNSCQSWSECRRSVFFMLVWDVLLIQQMSYISSPTKRNYHVPERGILRMGDSGRPRASSS